MQLTGQHLSDVMDLKLHVHSLTPKGCMIAQSDERKQSQPPSPTFSS